MKKTFTITILFLIFNLLNTQSQPWHYDFGTGTGVLTAGIDSSILPSVPSGFYKLRIGSGLGEIRLINSSSPFSTESYIRITAPTNTSVNKFVVYDYNPGKAFTMKFTVRFGSSDGSNTAASGSMYFFVGDGASFIGNVGFTGAQIFTGMQFIFGSSGAITANYRSGGSWIALPGSPIMQAQNYVFEIYGNNTTTTKLYNYGSIDSVGANKWDLYIDGILVGNDLSKGQIVNDVNIDSWMFYGESSTGNVANIFLDEFDYHNDIAGTPLPVTMGSFEMYSVGRAATLNWNTTSEINNSGFEIERRTIAGSLSTEWQRIAFIPGNGTTSEIKNYTYSDNNLKAGNYKYRLKQIDYNGNFEYFSPANAEYVTIVKPNEFSLGQNYPNPSNPVSKIDYQVPFAGRVNITVFDITGKVVRVLVDGFQTADYHSVTFDGTGLASGIYFYRINGSSENLQFTKTMKMVLVK